MYWLGRSAGIKNTARVVGVVAAAALLASACGSSAPTSKPASTPKKAAASGNPITIPVIGDFTGSDAFFGTSQVAGMQPALAALNNAGGIGGRPLKLDECDTQSTVSGAAQCGSKFASSPLVLALSVIANIKAALPSLTNTLFLASTNLLNPAKSSNAFQVAPPGASVDDVVDQVAKASHFSTVGIVATDDAVGEAQIKFITAAKGPVKLNVQFVSPTASDDTVAIEKLVSSHVPMIYAAALGSAGAAVVKAYDELKPTVPLVLTGADASYGFLKGISTFEPTTNLYTIPGTPLVPGDITPGQSTAAMSAYMKAIQASAGHTPDTLDVSGEYAIDVTIALLKGVGLSSTLAAKEAWLHANTIDSLTNVSFSNPALNVLSNVPPGFDKISGTAFSSASMNLAS
jgi:ABC-type branched-subunit amino acid transport system substrate-binding protein